MTAHSIHRLTSLGRPLDPRYATNRAVLWILPLAGVARAAAELASGGPPGRTAWAAAVGALGVFGAWALARELAPDDDPAAFVSMALGFATLWLPGAPSLLLLFAALALVRIVNRSVGLPARIHDSAMVTALVIWAAWSSAGPALGLVAALAFTLDAVLPGARRVHLLFAGLCLGASATLLLRDGLPRSEGPWTAPAASAVSITALLFVVAIARTHQVTATGDATGVPLSAARVRAGMLVGLLAAAGALAGGRDGLGASLLVWAAVAGVALGALRGPRRPAAPSPEA